MSTKPAEPAPTPPAQPTQPTQPAQPGESTPAPAPTTPPSSSPLPEGDQAGAGGAPPAGAPPPDEPAPAPKKSAAELKVAEGVDADAVKAFATRTKLAPEVAQQVADFVAQTQEAQRKAAAAELEKLQSSWQSHLKADPDFGGASYDANVQAARKVIAKYASEADKADLEASKLGDYPTVVRILARVGKALGEDTLAGTSSGNGAPARDASAFTRALYPNSPELQH